MAIKIMRPNEPWCMWPGTALARVPAPAAASATLATGRGAAAASGSPRGRRGRPG